MLEPLIISVDKFKAYASISGDFDDNVLSASIISATDLHCQEILGTALTEKLITDFNADSLTGLYQELYSSTKASVEKMVVWQTFVNDIPKFAYKVQNNGIGKSGGDLEGSVEPIDKGDLAILQNSSKGKMLRYENQVKNFLIENYNDIPELSDTTPEFLKPHLTKKVNDNGISSTPNRVYNDF